MTQNDRDPITRTTLLMGRVERLVKAGVQPDSQALADLHRDVLLAFQQAELRGEMRGMHKGSGLSKLTPQERSALGLA